MKKPRRQNKAKLFRQHKVPIIGPITDVLSYGAVWIGMLNFLMIAITLYWTTLRPHLLRYVPWMNMGIYLACLFALVCLLLLFVYKFIVPSYYEFRGRQYQRHGGMAASNDNIAGIRDMLGVISKRLESLEKNSGIEGDCQNGAQGEGEKAQGADAP
jgi:hypothetical protein